MLLWRKQFRQILEKEDQTELNTELQEVRTYAISLADLILTPINNFGHHKLFREVEPDLDIMYEATLSSEATNLLAFAKMPLTQDGVLPATAWIELGDPKQSNNVVISTYVNNKFNAPCNGHVGKLESAYAILKASNPDMRFDVEFGSIDGFQGRDKEFVILSYPNTASAGFTANDGRFVFLCH